MSELKHASETNLLQIIKGDNQAQLAAYDVNELICFEYQGGNIFHLAAASNSGEVFSHLAAIAKDNLNLQQLLHQPDDKEITPLEYAVKSDTIKIIKGYQENGYLENARSRGCNALHLAAMYGSNDIANYILRLDFADDYLAAEDDGNTPLMYAIKYKRQSLVWEFYNFDASVVNQVSSKGDTPLMVATRGAFNFNIVYQLLMWNVKFQDVMGENNCFIAAIKAKHIETVGFMLRHKFYIDVRSNKLLALQCAAEANQVAIIDLMAKNNFFTEINTEAIRDIAHTLPGLSEEMREKLNALAADANQQQQYLSTKSMLIDFNNRDITGKTQLHHAVISEGVAEVMCLLDLKADVRAVDNTGMLPLHYAISLAGKDFSIVKMLIKRDPATCTIADNNGNTPIDLALNNWELVIYLIENYLDFGFVKQQHEVISQKSDEIGPKVLAVLATAKDSKKNTLLHYFLEKVATVKNEYRGDKLAGLMFAIRMLLNSNAKIDCKNQDGKTPLQLLPKFYLGKKTKDSTYRVIKIEFNAARLNRAVNRVINECKLRLHYEGVAAENFEEILSSILNSCLPLRIYAFKIDEVLVGELAVCLIEKIYEFLVKFVVEYTIRDSSRPEFNSFFLKPSNAFTTANIEFNDGMKKAMMEAIDVHLAKYPEEVNARFYESFKKINNSPPPTPPSEKKPTKTIVSRS